MSDKTGIEWTATIHADGTVTPGATWNPVRGCVKVSPGCANCYAETFAERWRGIPGHAYERGFDPRTVPEVLDQPIRWKRPRKIFVNSMSDLFQDAVPDAYIDQVFAVMALAPQHTFQILTKRAGRMHEYSQWTSTSMRVWRALGQPGEMTWPLPNVWLGVSVENQHFADERIPLLLRTPAAVRFISAEPLLGPLNLANSLESREARMCVDKPSPRALSLQKGAATSGQSESLEVGNVAKPHSRPGQDPCAETRLSNSLDWVIVGGESGPGARPFDIAWARSIVQQCRAAGVAVFVKQLGAVPVGTDLPLVGLKSRKGGDPDEWPADLRIRQFPAGAR